MPDREVAEIDNCTPAAVVPRPPGRTLEQLSRHGVGELHGVGPRKVTALRALGIESVLDLLMTYPRRYADRTNAVRVAEAAPGEEAVVSGTVRSVESRRLRGGRTMVMASVDDGTGLLHVSFFNQPWRAQQLRRGSEVVLFGKPEWYRQRLSMTNPIVDVIAGPGTTERERRTGRIVPIYRQSERAGVSSPEIADLAAEALRRAGSLADPLPEELRDRLRLTGRTEALNAIHAPQSTDERWAARRRLAFDELFRLQVELVLRKRAVEAASRGVAHRVEGGGLLDGFLAALPFALTSAQRAAISEIAGDLARPVPMHRLLQGDVGSGKTVVALATLLMAVQGGYQGAFMVPTEVLAEQHFLAARRACSPGSRSPTRAVSAGSAHSRWRCSRAAPARRSAPGCEPSSPQAASTSSSARTPSSPTTSSSPRSASSSSTSSTVSASTSVRRYARRGRATTPTCSS